ncbi:MAG: hypothetical protein ACYDCN_15410 [Bacteroidia bacterium]
MAGKILLFVGVILIGVGVLISQSNNRVRVGGQWRGQGTSLDADESKNINMYIGGGVGGLGLIFVILGVSGMVRSSKQNKDKHHIMETGIPGTATVLSTKEMGATMNTGGTLGSTMLKIELEVKTQGSDAYSTSIESMVSVVDLAQFQPGKVYHVIIDKLDKMKVIFNPNKFGNPPMTISNGKNGFAEVMELKRTDKVKNGFYIYNVKVEFTGENIEKYSIDREIPLPDPDFDDPFRVGEKFTCLIDKTDKTKFQLLRYV